jgi:hypothetical protein
MGADFRALSLDLADAYLRVLEHVNNSTFLGYEPSDDPLLQRARAALAANHDPAPAAPKGCALGSDVPIPPGLTNAWGKGMSVREGMEAAYRLGFTTATPAPVPDAEGGPSDEELWALCKATGGNHRATSLGWPIVFARALLARYGTPAPVPVAEQRDRPIWTEGVCGDGAALLKDGVMTPIEEVVAELNRGAAAIACINELVAAATAQPECP